MKKCSLDEAVKALKTDPLLGIEKVGDLSCIRAYKFHMIGCLTPLAYKYDKQDLAITLLALGSHENFYRDLKTQINYLSNIARICLGDFIDESKIKFIEDLIFLREYVNYD